MAVSDDLTPTPVEVPRAPSEGGNDNGTARGNLADIRGIPQAGPEEDTGRIRSAILTASDDGPVTSHGIAAALVELMGSNGPGGSGSGGGPPPIDIKKFRKGNWWVQLAIGIVVAASGAFAAYKATEARSVDNEAAIKTHAEEPMHIQAQEEIRVINARIGNVGTRMQAMQTQQTTIVQGIDALKKEAQTDKQKRLEETVNRLERENRRLERRNR